MAKPRWEQTLDDFSIGDKVEWTYFLTSWKIDTLIGTVAGFTKHRIRIEFDDNRFGLKRRTLPPTSLTRYAKLDV